MTQAEKGEAENGKDKEREREREQRGAKRPIVPAAVPESLQEVSPGWARGGGDGSGPGPGRGLRHPLRPRALCLLAADTEQLHRGHPPRLRDAAPRPGHGHAACGHPARHRAAAAAARAGGLQGQLAPQGRP